MPPVFGLSLGKILLLVLLVVVVWKASTYFSQLTRSSEREKVGKGTRPGRQPGTIELVECRECGAYFDPRVGCRCRQARR
jgi:hypothetical protein